ncbi:MAG: radical SAM protein [Sandaracinaceae bacterium]|nr:radical SAM protein [Sandaracinaceae bacterium]
MQEASSKPKRRLGLALPPPTRGQTIERLAAELRELDEARAIAHVGARHVDRLLKSTVGLCPSCLAPVPALVFERGVRVILAKRCATHGTSEAVIENDRRYYSLSNKDRHGRRFADDRVFRIPDYTSPILPNGLSGDGACCAPGEACDTSPAASLGEHTDQLQNRSCTVLVEVTDACNLACKVCYSESAGERFMPLSTFQSHVRELVAKKGRIDSLQITGGESSLHPRFWELVDFAYREPGIQKIFVPTNGLRLARAEERARFAPYADKIVVLLQFDALSREVNHEMRGAEPAELRRRIVADLDRLGVPMQLTMTLARGVNEHEIGGVLDVALEHRMVKLVAMQPVTWSGRFELGADPMDRLTLSDVAHAIQARAHVRMRREDFVPIPCSHPNCGWLTVFLRRFGLVHNVVRYVDLDKVMNDVAYKTLLSTSELREVVGTADRAVLARVAGWLGKRVVRSTDMFSIAIKPFMDRHTYDQDRVANCCHHITDTRGVLRSFCEYNALDRRDDPWTRFPTRDAVG